MTTFAKFRSIDPKACQSARRWFPDDTASGQTLSVQFLGVEEDDQTYGDKHVDGVRLNFQVLDGPDAGRQFSTDFIGFEDPNEPGLKDTIAKARSASLGSLKENCAAIIGVDGDQCDAWGWPDTLGRCNDAAKQGVRLSVTCRTTKRKGKAKADGTVPEYENHYVNVRSRL